MSQQTAHLDPLHQGIRNAGAMALCMFLCTLYLGTSFFCFWGAIRTQSWQHWALGAAGVAYFVCFTMAYLNTFETKKDTPWVLLVILIVFFYLLM